MLWKKDWPLTRQHMIDWWDHKGLVLALVGPGAEAVEEIAEPPKPSSIEARYCDAAFHRREEEYQVSRSFLGADTIPFFDTYLGPGSLGIFLGAAPNFTEETVWYEPCISQADSFGPIEFNPANNHWFDVQMKLIDEGVRHAEGRYLVGMPDMVENLDTLAAMRGNEALLMDLIERPSWVKARLEEINRAYFDVFDRIHSRIKNEDGGNIYSCYRIWGPGKTAKIQCDISCMLSPAMFNEFALPHLKAQCRFLDYSMYHLDGTTALQHLDSLLAMDELDAIQWTPQAGKPTSGEKHWYDLYRQIKAAGKSIEVCGPKVEDIVPLLDAVGPEGTFILADVRDCQTAQRLVQDCERFRA